MSSSSTLHHHQIIDSADTLFVIGAAIFTSLLSEGISSLTHPKLRHIMAPHLQTLGIQDTHREHYWPYQEDRKAKRLSNLSRSCF